jgi:ribonuclease H2 subunit A
LNFKYFPLDPKDLSNDQLGNVKNLNGISHDTAISLITAAVKEGNKITHVYVDTVGPPDKYQRMLENKFPGINFRVEST